MQNAARAVLALVLTFVAGPRAFAQPDVRVEGRSYYASAHYYTTAIGEFAITFSEHLPYGSRVRVHYGFGGETTIYDSTGPRKIPLSWEGIDDVEARAVSPFVWQAQLRQTLQERGSPRKLDALQFVFAVVLPDGSEYYVKGSDSRLGFYQVMLPAPATTGEATPMRALRLTQVSKD